jgi:phosphoribosyl 1,2-cyclic phosphodiesterase
LKRRVGGPRGHLNNGQAAALLAWLERSRLQVVAMAHLSSKNNTEALARAALAPLLGQGQQLCAADQAQGLAWCEVV